MYGMHVCMCKRQTKKGCARNDVWGVQQNCNPICLWGVEFGVIYAVLFFTSLYCLDFLYECVLSLFTGKLPMKIFSARGKTIIIKGIKLH